jgi:hypothetical protein
MTALTTFAFYGYVMFVLPDHRPSLMLNLVFGTITTIFFATASLIQWPLLYEYIPRAKMGTAGGGMELMSGLFGLILMPLAGLWVEQHSKLFLPGAGSEVRVTLSAPADQARVDQLLAAPAPGGEESIKVLNTPWFPPGEFAPTSREWVIRERDPQGDALLGATRDAESAYEQVVAEQKDAAKSASAAKLEKLAAEVTARRSKATALRADLDARTQRFQDRVTGILGPNLTRNGAELLALQRETSTLLLIPCARRVSRREIETVELELVPRHPEIAAVLASPGDPRGLAIALRATPEAAAAPALRAAILRDLRALPTIPRRPEEKPPGWFDDDDPLERRQQLAGLFAADLGSATATYPLLRFTLETLSAPTRATLDALATPLQEDGIRLVRLAPATDRNGIVVTALFLDPAAAAPAAPAVSAPVQAQFRAANAGFADRTADAGLGLYDEIVRGSDGLNLIVPRPVVKAVYASRKYDYFSGYLLQGIGTVVGILCIFLVVFWERRGLIRKLGVEEETQLKQAAAAAANGATPPNPVA